MYNFDKESFRKYFFDGENNPIGALDGIIFHVYSEMIATKSINEIKYIGETKIANKEENKDREFIEEDSERIKRTISAFANMVLPLYTQYYRFVELNNKAGIYYYKLEDKKELRKKIEQRIIELMTEGKIRITEDGISYSREEIKQYAHFMEGSITQEEWETKYQPFTIYNPDDWQIKDIPHDINTWYTMQAENKEKQKQKYKKEEFASFRFEHWTKALSKILVALNEIEKEDEKAYYDLWFRTRLKRAKSTKHPIEGIEEKEIQSLEKVCRYIRVSRLAEEKKEDRDR